MNITKTFVRARVVNLTAICTCIEPLANQSNAYSKLKPYEKKLVDSVRAEMVRRRKVRSKNAALVGATA